MSSVVIVLIIIGLAFIFVSYAFASKFEKQAVEDEGPIEIPDELTEEQKEKISKLINDFMYEAVDRKLDEVEYQFAEIVNEKTLALGDYAVTVNDEISKNHNEVVFLYSMLSDKQKEIMTTANMVDEYRKEVETFVERNNLSVTPNREAKELEEEIKELDDSLLQEEDLEEAVNAMDSNSKDIILEMHKSGLSILEIAKHLGLGVGEVKLVVDLYQGEHE
ncbi:MAG: DUF6115 domain-containing protein [Clostridium sp.]|nr:DUF6115 domain-containing protein [Clostridium sp.]MCM1172659.1 DUF6115 domain-containing protein [Clostridium sp.]MCM1207681.1 DUF6115 domain-containing protein [Ruminococcus sp.]